MTSTTFTWTDRSLSAALPATIGRARPGERSTVLPGWPTSLTDACAYGASADFGFADTQVGADMAKRRIPVIGHPSTARRPQGVSL